MIINEQGKLFGKISIIDICVVLAIVIIAIGFSNKFINPVSTIVLSSTEIEYEVLIRGVRDATLEALQKKGTVIDGRTREALGVITDVRFEPAYQEVSPLDGSFELFEIQDRHDVIITVRVDGRINENGFYTYQNKLLSNGSSVRLQTKYSVTSGEIIGIWER